MDAIARRNSNFASASQNSFNDGHSAGSDQDDDGDEDKDDAESADISISLDDVDLENLVKTFFEEVDCKLSSLERLNTQIQNNISAAEERNKSAL